MNSTQELIIANQTFELNTSQQAFVVVESNFSNSSVYPLTFIINSSDKNDNQTGVAVTAPKHYSIKVFGTEGFDPEEITINQGDEVSWKNEDKSDLALFIFKDDEKYLYPNLIKSGDVFGHNFTERGAYDVYSNVAYGPIVGKVIVENENLEAVEKEDIEKRKAEYNADYLIEDLKDILGGDYYNFSRDPTHPDHIRSSHVKYYVIHTRDNQINTFEEFCDEYCAENWDGINYYLNMSDFNAFYPLMERNEFPTEGAYMHYYQNRVLVNHTRIESSYEVENGKVLEYKFYFWEQDLFGNFERSIFDTLVIYKVYCS